MFERFLTQDPIFGDVFDREGAGEALAATLCAAFKAVHDDFAVGILANGKFELVQLYWPEDSAHSNAGDFAGYEFRLVLDPALYALYAQHESDANYNDDFKSRCYKVAGPLLKDVEWKRFKVEPALVEENSAWRQDARAFLGGAGVNNQGNVKLSNRPKILHDELFFRHIEEQYVYEALASRGVPLMPLPVVLRPDGTRRPDGVRRRIEPDFCFLYHGRFIVLEIDGGSHWETPADADGRVTFLREHGAIVRRIHADRCADSETARLAVSDLLASLDRELTTR